MACVAFGHGRGRTRQQVCELDRGMVGTGAADDSGGVDARSRVSRVIPTGLRA